MKVTQQTKHALTFLKAGPPVSARLRCSLRAVIALACLGSFAHGVSAAPVASKKSGLPAPATRAASSKPAAPKLAGVVVTGDYILGPDDKISVNSASHEEVSLNSILVPADGKLNLPMLGAFSVTGKTLAKLEKEILARMNREGFLRPMVTVTLQEARVHQVFVLSAAGGAGSVTIKPGFRVSDTLALAGGLGNTRPELTDATLSRASSSTPIVLDLPSIMRDSNSRANILVQNGDTIRLIARTIQINVAGKVAKPGMLEIPIGSTLVEVIALAGGVDAKSALTRASLKRAADGSIIPINFHDILIKGLPAPKIELQEGDLILIPESQDQVTIQGAVANSGYFPIPDGKTLRISELIALAGGAQASASLTRTSVQHADGTMQLLNLYEVLALGDNTDNIELRPDDIVTVPAYTEQIVVAGSGVRSIGFFPIEEGKNMRILDALTKAGGLVTEPESTLITITRGMPDAVPTADRKTVSDGRLTLTVDAKKLYKSNDLNENILLKNGDMVMVTSQPRLVYVLGEVKSPGAITLGEGEGLVEMLTKANGITEKGLASAVVVERDGVKRTVDVFSALAKGEPLNFPIFPGDNIVVPVSMNRVLVMGGVSEAGYINIPEDRPLSLTEAITIAGGTRGDTKRDQTVVLRQTANGMTQIKTPIKTPQQMVDASKIVLQTGDIVFVPELEPKKPGVFDKVLKYSSIGRLFGFPLPF